MNKVTKTLLTVGAACALAVTSFAAGNMISISVDPSVRILVNGSEFQPKDANGNDVMTFIYNGTTYAPLRALAEAYGLEVGYDAARNMATVSEPGKVYDTLSIYDYMPYNFTDGYSYAEFNKYNSPAEENGLGDTPVYFSGILTDVSVLELKDNPLGDAYLGTVNSEYGSWCVILDLISLSPNGDYSEYLNKEIVICGIYGGFSELKQMPSVTMDKMYTADTESLVSGFSTFLEVENSLYTEKYESGQYKIGVDMPAGKYIVFATDFLSYFKVSNDANGEDSIYSSFFVNQSIIQVEDGEYLDLDDCYAIPYSDDYLLPLPSKNYDSGTYIVGVHIPAGEYKLSAIYADKEANYTVYNNLRRDDMIGHNYFEGTCYVSLNDGDCLIMERCELLN